MKNDGSNKILETWNTGEKKQQEEKEETKNANLKEKCT